jgi:translation initiation factor IF-2
LIVAGSEYGRLRAMHDYLARDVITAGPSEPVEIIGLSGVPMAGDTFHIVSDEKTARDAADWRVQQIKKQAAAKSSAASLEDLLNRVKSEDVLEVPIILKADTQGSLEAISDTILKLSTPKIKTRLIHSAVGGVTESDITLGQASGALVIGFNVRAMRGLDDLAERSGVPIKYFSIIYEIVDAVKAIMVGKLPPIINEVIMGHAEVRKPINVPKIGTIAGSAVLDGKITRSSQCRLIRDSVVIYTGKLGSLRRFKDDVKEVAQGFECGIGIDGYNDIREGDVIEVFALEETVATL